MNKDYQYPLVPQKYATVHSAPITPGVEMSDMSDSNRFKTNHQIIALPNLVRSDIYG